MTTCLCNCPFQLVAVVQPDAVLELGGGSHSPWMAQDKREVLSEILAQAFRLKVRRKKDDSTEHVHIICNRCELSVDQSPQNRSPADGPRRFSYSIFAMVWGKPGVCG